MQTVEIVIPIPFITKDEKATKNTTVLCKWEVNWNVKISTVNGLQFQQWLEQKIVPSLMAFWEEDEFYGRKKQ